jgi:uncharacterized MAPEG superfamily protein
MTIALWAVLIAGILPYVATGIAKGVGGTYDNNDPRGRAEGYDGVAKRAYAAHLNSFEAFPLFAVAVLVAEMKGGPRGLVDPLAVGFILCRLGYIGAYLTDKASLRSVLWLLALSSAIVIFISPLWR